jgi:hypothetical protein
MWFDRLTGDRIDELPRLIESSRYVSLRGYRHNQHTQVNPGEFVVDDGSRHLLTDHADINFYQVEQNSDSEVESDLVDSALREFQDALDSGRDPAFLLPEKLFEWLNLQPLDELIREVLDKGHLHEIARSPNMDLIYVENLLPIGRVKKIPSSATKHLAAHSECWQKRSFTGVVPKSLLALESEDEYNIYENRVYVRLLDHLERYLIRRCSEVTKIEEVIKKAGDFSPDRNLYWPMARGILELWKEGYGKSDEVDEGGGSTLLLLKKMLKSIRGLRQTPLYRAIPFRDDVGVKIRLTNTLTHDQHYRHVARLWHTWQNFNKDTKLEPKTALFHNQILAKSYFNYVKCLIEKALSDLGLEKKRDGEFLLPKDGQLVISCENNNICLKYQNSTLTFIPILSDINSNIDDQNRIVVSPENLGFSNDLNIQCASSLYFYSLEAVVNRISTWMLTFRITAFYRSKIQKIPSEVVELILQSYPSNFIVEGTTAYLKGPAINKINKIKESLRRSASINTSVMKFLKDLGEHSALMNDLLICPLCRQEATERNFTVRDKRAFQIQGECDHMWRVDLDSKGKRTFVALPSDSVDIKSMSPQKVFLKYGRYHQSIFLG